MRHKLLLIDDSQSMHHLVRASLGDEAVVIGSALDGKSGIELAIATNPDLILLDVDMPGMDGFEVCRRLGADVRTANIPIVFLTAMNESQQKVQGFDQGASDYVTKPFDPAEFAARIRAVIRTKKKIDSIRSHRVNDFIRGSLQASAGKNES